jgi:hypothetical protein
MGIGNVNNVHFLLSCIPVETINKLPYSIYENAKMADPSMLGCFNLYFPVANKTFILDWYIAGSIRFNRKEILYNLIDHNANFKLFDYSKNNLKLIFQLSTLVKHLKPVISNIVKNLDDVAKIRTLFTQCVYSRKYLSQPDIIILLDIILDADSNGYIYNHEKSKQKIITNLLITNKQEIVDYLIDKKYVDQDYIDNITQRLSRLPRILPK